MNVQELIDRLQAVPGKDVDVLIDGGDDICHVEGITIGGEGDVLIVAGFSAD